LYLADHQLLAPTLARFDLVALCSEHLLQDFFLHQSLNSPERFRWFSQDYLGFDEEKSLVTDVRYSMLPNQIEPMWGLVSDDLRDTNEHAIWWTGRDLDQSQ
jgi:hypothetical protein